MNHYRLLSWSAIIISFTLLVLPRFIPICNGVMKNGHPMNCHYAYQVEFIVALLALILSGALLVLRTTEARLLAGFIIVLLGITVVVLLQPWVIGICEAGGCLKTAYFTNIAAYLLSLTGARIVWLTRKGEDG